MLRCLFGQNLPNYRRDDIYGIGSSFNSGRGMVFGLCYCVVIIAINHAQMLLCGMPVKILIAFGVNVPHRQVNAFAGAVV